jgi:hypothetical protein
MIKTFAKGPRTKLNPEAYVELKLVVLNRDGWVAKIADRHAISKSITNSFAAVRGKIQRRT